MASLSPDCRDGNHTKCYGLAWDLERDCQTSCTCECHRPADEEYRAALAASLEAHRVDAENEQARQDSLGD